MVTMLKVKARWHGFTGGPGYSNFFFREFSTGQWAPTATEATQAVDRTKAFFQQIGGLMPPVVNVQVESECEVIEDTDGSLVDVVQAASTNNVAGSSSNSNYSAATGAVVSWGTGSVRNGRRVRGRTFLVPLSSAVFDSNGTLTQPAVDNISTAATNMVSGANPGPDFGIYCRPTSPVATDGAWFVATSSRVPDMGAILRSRRD